MANQQSERENDMKKDKGSQQQTGNQGQQPEGESGPATDRSYAHSVDAVMAEVGTA